MSTRTEIIPPDKVQCEYCDSTNLSTREGCRNCGASLPVEPSLFIMNEQDELPTYFMDGGYSRTTKSPSPYSEWNLRGPGLSDID